MSSDPENNDDNARETYVSPADYKRPSDRIFRRSRSARARRKASDKSDFRFISAMLQLSVLAAMVLVAGGVFAQRFMQPGASRADGLSAAVAPVFAGLSIIELVAIFIAIIFAAVILWRARR